jgi:hypothetical protein
MTFNDGFLYLSKWELIEVLCTVNSHLFVFGQPKRFVRILKRVYNDKELKGLDRSLVMVGLRSTIDGEFYDYFLTK